MFDSIIDGIQFIKNYALTMVPAEAHLYIPLQATTAVVDNAERFDLQTEVSQFISSRTFGRANSNAKVLLLLGDTGSGKSMFAENYYRHLWQQYQPGQAIPLWLPLPELKNPFGEAIEDVLLNFGFDKAQIAELKTQHQFIIIADGYDELHSWQNIYMSNHFAEWNAKVIVTCRSQAVYHIRDFEKYFTPYQEDQPLRHLLMKLFVAPFSENQIDHYLQQYQKQQRLVSSPEDDNNNENKKFTLTQAQLCAIPGLADLITTPFLLYLAVEALPDIFTRFQNAEITQQSKLTLAALYDVFIERWFNRQVIKLIETGHITKDENFKLKLWQFCQSLGSKMHQQNLSHVQYNTSANLPKKSLFGKNKNDIANPWATFFSAENTVLRSGCPLRQFGENIYGFVHTSFVEYFATRAMYEQSLIERSDEKISASAAATGVPVKITSFPTSSSSAETTIPISDEKPLALNDSIHYRLFTQEPNAIRMLADRVLQYPSFKKKLFEHIERSKTDGRYAIGAANAITALNCAEVSFSGMNLQKIRITQANLENTLMDYTELSGADLTGVTFKNACLQNANLTEAILSSVNFEEEAYIETSKKIKKIKISPNERLIAIANGDEIEILDSQTCQRIYLLRGEAHVVDDICFSPNGTILVSAGVAGLGKTICFWDLTTGLAIGLPQTNSRVTSYLAISPDGKMLVSGDTNDIYLWDMKTQQIEGKAFNGEHILLFCLTFSPNGEYLAYGSDLHFPKLWSTKTRAFLNKPFRGHRDSITAIAFSFDGNLLISGSRDNSIRIWEVTSGDAVRVIEDAHNKPITSLTVSVDGNIFASSSEDHMISLWDLTSGARIGESLSGHTQRVTSLAFTPDGKMLFSSGEDKILRRWHIKTSEPKHLENIKSHKDHINCIASTANGQYLASGSEDRMIILWEITNNRIWGEMLVGHELAVKCLTFSPDGRVLASGSSDQTVRLWDTHSKKLIALPLRGHQARITTLAYSNDAQKLASGSMDNTIIIRNVSNLEVLFTLTGHHHPISSLTFSPDSRFLFTGSWDKSTRLWNVETGAQSQIVQQFNHRITSVAWSHDGRTIAASEGNMVSLWDSSTYKQYPQSPSGHSDLITAISFSPNNNLLVSASLDNTLRVWNPFFSTNLDVQILQGHTQAVTSVLFLTPERIMSGSQDYSLRIWQLKTLPNQEKKWVTVWRSRPYTLQITGANLNTVSGLSESNQKLLAQRGTEKIKIVEHKSSSDITVASQKSCSSLIDAAEKGLLDEVQLFLQLNGDVNQINDCERTPLYFASWKGHTKVVQLLIDAGADVNQADENGWTALTIASDKGHADVVQLLLNAKAKVNQTDNEGNTAVNNAAQNGHSNVVQLLIDAGADSNQKKQGDGMTPLLSAVTGGYPDVVQLLVNANADVTHEDNNGWTPLLNAATSGDTEIISLLIAAHADVNQANHKGVTALFYAANQNKAEAVRLLIKAKADVDHVAHDGSTPLWEPVQNGHPEILKLFIDAKANVNHSLKDGTTPLYIAAQCGHLEVVRLLIHANANIHTPNNDGQTPLFVASEYGNTKILELLLQMKATVNQSRKDGTTPLLIAVENGHTDTAKLLLEAKADVRLASKDGTTPLSKAIKKGLNEVAELIRTTLTANTISADTINSTTVTTSRNSNTWERARPAVDVSIGSTNVFIVSNEATQASSATTNMDSVLNDQNNSSNNASDTIMMHK